MFLALEFFYGFLFLNDLRLFYGLTTIPLYLNTFCLPTGSREPALHDDFWLYLFGLPILHFDMDRCVNCTIAFGRCGTVRRRDLNEETLFVIRQWRMSETVNSSDSICQACWDLAQQAALRTVPIQQPGPVGHSSVCVRCGHSLVGQRVSHLLHTGSAREMAIYNVIREWIMPRHVSELSSICHSCWVQADRARVHMVSEPSTSTQIDESTVIPELNLQFTENQPAPVGQETIFLPEYTRAIETESRCFIEGCQRTDRYRVPLATRKMLFNQYKYYVPPNNRLCDIHLVVEAWDFLDSFRNNYTQPFTARHIEDMFLLKELDTRCVLNFSNIDEMADSTVYNWIGFSKTQFNQLFNEVPQFLEVSNGSLVLASYLMKLRTGESNERLCTLLKVCRKTFEKYVHMACNILCEYFVPLHLGFNHINREQLLQKNLLIPQALFGNFDGEAKPIIIIDGTYCYIEKSSNYLFQKRTYSLHKYRNLVKPFLLVSTDGHIIEVLGPYPATTYDADIIKHEVLNENSTMRQYFREGDAFILDRGFRDALPILNSYGYRTYVPGSLSEGETQLSTISANKSRAVTICRWVVEVVNGRFKRDFKLLRQNYFNNSNKSLMKDFEVAAALLNRFHPPIVDRLDAGEIINQINENMNKPNELADFVIRNNYNRRRADFDMITVQNDNLNNFPQLTYDELILISLGTYQIKQARSYLGEHTRGDSGFMIEVCYQTSSSLQRELSTSNTSWLLRGRIQSRHISRKTYFIYILVDSSRRGRESILQYYCNCIVGRRTVGCCAHVMAIIWYLSWARYQDNIVPPAQFLDNNLIIFEDE